MAKGINFKTMNPWIVVKQTLFVEASSLQAKFLNKEVNIFDREKATEGQMWTKLNRLAT